MIPSRFSLLLSMQRTSVGAVRLQVMQDAIIWNCVKTCASCPWIVEELERLPVNSTPNTGQPSWNTVFYRALSNPLPTRLETLMVM
jgi:hypothetical protein